MKKIVRSKTSTSFAVLGACAVAAFAGLGVSQVLAEGAPKTEPLYYDGLLHEGGVPIEGEENVVVELYDSADERETDPVCSTQSDNTEFTAGRFRIALSDECADQVRSNSDLWVRVTVAGAGLGRKKIGAVPYALEADHAESADLAKQAEVADELASGSHSIDGDLEAANITTDGQISGVMLSLRQCAGGADSCTPLDCVALCQANGQTVATLDQLFAYAAGRNDSCFDYWALDITHRDQVARAMPMYNSQTDAGCGVVGTGFRPRLERVDWANWPSDEKANCACSSLLGK